MDPYNIITLLLKVIQLDPKICKDKEKEVYRLFLRALSDYRVLTSSMQFEYTGEVINSVQKLRELIGDSIQNLPGNSRSEDSFFILRELTHTFLTKVKDMERNLKIQIQGAESRTESFAKEETEPYKGDLDLIKKWKNNGYPERVLFHNENLNVLDISPHSYQLGFVQALGEFRGSFGMALNLICVKLNMTLPQSLSSLVNYNQSE